MRLMFLLLSSWLALFDLSMAYVKCVDAEGEAVIVNNDVPSAKIEAIARAKWNAVEQVGGVAVKAQTVVQNFALVDDMVTKQIKGLITNYSVKKTTQEGEIIKAIVNVCVENTKVDEALSTLALNNSIAVFILVKKPKVVAEVEEVSGSKGKGSSVYGVAVEEEYEEHNILTEMLIENLTDRGIKVVELAPTNPSEAKMVENAIKGGNMTTLRSFMYQSLSNILLVGKVDYTVSTRKGQDVGYGISMPFNNVTSRLTYRLVAKEKDTQRIVVLSAGVEEGKALAPNLEDAFANSLKSVAEQLTPKVFDKLNRYIQGVSKAVKVKVLNVKDISATLEIKSILQNIAWVTDVQEKGVGEFVVGYPENVLYLANSLSQKGFEVVEFSPYSLVLTLKQN